MREWNAREYERVSAPQLRWGAAVVDGVVLRGDECALDAGCGTGRVTRLLAQRLPAGRVIAVDASAAMAREAGRRLADLAPRVSVRQMDLLELELAEPVEVILSTATFHWILDHAALFTRLHAALAPGGRLVAQCGGAGNLERVLSTAAVVAAIAPFRAHLAGLSHDVLFADAPATRARLADAGFTDVHTWLHDSPEDVGGVEDGALFLATVVLRAPLTRLPDDLRAPYVHAVAQRLAGHGGRVRLDYVRLEMRARRPDGKGVTRRTG